MYFCTSANCCTVFTCTLCASASSNWYLHYAHGAPSSENVLTQYRTITFTAGSTTRFNANHTYSCNLGNSSSYPTVLITSSYFSSITLNNTKKSDSRTLPSLSPSTSYSLSYTVRLNNYQYCTNVQSSGSSSISAVL